MFPFTSDLDGNFSGTITASEPTGSEVTPNHTYDVGVLCKATGKMLVAATFTFAASSTTTTAPSGTGPAIRRISGTDRIGTGIAASLASFPTAGSAGAVVVASADNYPDGLAGTPLAAGSTPRCCCRGPTRCDPMSSPR